MNDCIFCKIINKQSAANIIFEDSETLVFTPLDQISKGHLLIIPKYHFENIFDIEDVTFSHVTTIAKKMAIESLKIHNATGVNILNANGEDAQQSVFHFHMHMVPRYKDDGLDLWLRNRL